MRIELRNTSETQLLVLKAIAPLQMFVDAELGTVVSKYLDQDLQAEALWLTDIMLKAGLIDGKTGEGYSVTEAGKSLLDENGGVDAHWIEVVDNWAAGYYLTLASRFSNHLSDSPQEIIYKRASSNYEFHHNRLNHLEE